MNTSVLTAPLMLLPLVRCVTPLNGASPKTSDRPFRPVIPKT